MSTPTQILPSQTYPTAAADVLKTALAGRLGLAAHDKIYSICSMEMLSMECGLVAIESGLAAVAVLIVQYMRPRQILVSVLVCLDGTNVFNS